MFSELAAAVRTAAQGLLVQLRDHEGETALPCEIGVWGYYLHLRTSTCFGTALWDGTALQAVVPHASAGDLLEGQRRMTAAIRAYYLYGLARRPTATGGLGYIYVLPVHGIREVRVECEKDAAEIYYEVEALLPQYARLATGG
jgi:hypothetical protein